MPHVDLQAVKLSPMATKEDMKYIDFYFFKDYSCKELTILIILKSRGCCCHGLGFA